MKKIFLLFSVMGLLFGCSQDDSINNSSLENKEKGTLVAEQIPIELGDWTDSNGLRVSYTREENTAYISWDKEDKIGVCAISEDVLQQNKAFQYAEGTTKNGTFEGTKLNPGEYIAYYPYGSKLNSGKVVFDIPQQKQNGHNNIYLKDRNFMKSDVFNINTPTKELTSMKFEHALAFIEFRLDFPFLASGESITIYQIDMVAVNNNPDNNIFNQTITLQSSQGVADLEYSNPTDRMSLYFCDGNGNNTGNVFKYHDDEYIAWLLVPPVGKGFDFKLNIKTDRGIFTVSNFTSTNGGGPLRVANGFSNGVRYVMDEARLQFPSTATEWDGESYSVPMIDKINKKITIDCAEELAWVSKISNQEISLNGIANTFSGYEITLGKDIDLNNITWTPINTKGNFQGTFDGGGNSITGLEIKEGSAIGLFSAIGANGSVSNLIISGPAISTTGNNVGAFVGTNSGIVSNCHVVGGNISGNNNVGGIIGTNKNATIMDSNSEFYITTCTNEGCNIEVKKKKDAVFGDLIGNETVNGSPINNP